jgi:hemerythrin
MDEQVPWSDDLMVGVEAIDNDHKRLFELTNALLAARPCGPETTANAVAELISYTRRHFDAECALMERTAYPDLAAHAYEHDYLVYQLERIIDRLVGGGQDTAGEDLGQLLRYWLTNHILSFDAHFADYLRAGGRAAPG